MAVFFNGTLTLGIFVAGGFANYSEINNMCNQQGAIDELQDEINNMKGVFNNYFNNEGVDLDSLNSTANTFNEATQKYQNVLKNAQVSSKSKRIFLMVLLFCFNLIVLSSLFLKRYVSFQETLSKK
jgi:predicted PurR-regulated permease PerM